MPVIRRMRLARDRTPLRAIELLEKRIGIADFGVDVGEMLPGNLPHIGIVSDRKTMLGGTPLIIHNIGRGTREEDILFGHKVTGHYRPKP